MCEVEGMLAHAMTCDARFRRYAPKNATLPDQPSDGEDRP